MAVQLSARFVLPDGGALELEPRSLSEVAWLPQEARSARPATEQGPLGR